jgi:outer membrane protein assembly factor BamE (lipoprotein component of BamABCDE complex)
MKPIARFALSLIALMVAGCVNVDPETGQTIPRGDQRYKFADVERQAGKLKDGMTKMQVLILLGSPAEAGEGGNVWIYLPERPAVLVPSHALRLEFNNDILVSHGYRPIVLGNRF